MSKSRHYRRSGPGRVAKRGPVIRWYKLAKLVRRNALGGVIGGR